jgi:F5/8 type C domain
MVSWSRSDAMVDTVRVMSHPNRLRSLFGMIVVVVVLALSLAACKAHDPSVRSFSAVQASPITFEGDPSDPSRAVFRVTTTEPMICAIVWGEDDSFGRFNNSLSMNGTGIAQHDVVLPDVEPDVDYRYVVQGTTADGTLYRSGVSTFRIDGPSTPSTVAVDHGENLALGATVVEASSTFGDQFAPARAIDGDTATEWATQGDGDAGFLTLDLGAVRDLAGVEFLTRSMADGSSITDTFTVSVDGGAALGPFAAGTVADPRFTALIQSGRRLRFDVERSSGGNVGAVEIRVFGRAG